MTRERVRDHLDHCTLQTIDGGHIKAGEIEDLLRCDKIRVVGSFFDRDPRVYTWYYSMYARANNEGAYNAFANTVCKREHRPVRGPVVIVKDAPALYWDRLDKEVSAKTVTETLWYYMRSGVDAEEEFGMRTIMRMLACT